MFPRPLGRRVADLCAAPGSKTLQLAEWVEPGGLVVATDRHAGRLRRLTRAARRAGAGEILAIRGDMTAPVAPLRGAFERILVDAPCSGTGTMRRHPEIRWRLEEEDFKLLAARQSRLLATAAGLLAPGGVLVYAVCSMEPEEGEEVVATFLQSRPDFQAVDPRPDLPTTARELVDGSCFFRTTPAQGGLDGFFAARLQRSSNQASRSESR
jgi:16S rRNA (cytosine967-C5)-methyltransferase